jgi:hypothetical protein
MADSNYIAPSLAQQGYTGSTGSTPYRPATFSQVDQLNALAATSFSNLVTRAPAGAVQLTLNFDGTQNNRDAVKTGEKSTNIDRIDSLLPQGQSSYRIGIGAEGVEPGSIPSNLQSTPFTAGSIGQAILEKAYGALVEMAKQARQADPNAQIELNLTGFSRGGAEAVAFANLVQERGIPGILMPGSVVINSLLLYDPVNQTNGVLNTTWPANVRNALVFVATEEQRILFASMPVSSEALIFGVPGAHADVGGSFGLQGISAVTLLSGRNFLAAAGVPIGEIPANWMPDPSQFYVHNSSIDNFGNVKFDVLDSNRYFEGSVLGSLTVKDYLGFSPDRRPTPVYENVDGRNDLVGWKRTSTRDSTDPTTGDRVVTQEVTLLAKDLVTVTSKVIIAETRDAQGVLRATTSTLVAADGSSVSVTKGPENATVTTKRGADNQVITVTEERQVGTVALSTVKDGSGKVLEATSEQKFDDGYSLKEFFRADGSGFKQVKDPSGKVISTTGTAAPLDSLGAPAPGSGLAFCIVLPNSWAHVDVLDVFDVRQDQQITSVVGGRRGAYFCSLHLRFGVFASVSNSRPRRLHTHALRSAQRSCIPVRVSQLKGLAMSQLGSLKVIKMRCA